MPTATPQTAMDEKPIDDRELEKALEDREQAKGTASEARAKYTTLDEVCKDKIEEFKLAEGEVARVGRFRIEKKRVAPREVSFTAEATSRLSIKPDTEE